MPEVEPLLKAKVYCPCGCEAWGVPRPRWRGHPKECVRRCCATQFPPSKPSASLRTTAARINWLTVCEERLVYCAGRCEADGFHAATCDGTASPAGHHVLPRSKGGQDTFANTRMLHPDCHDKVHRAPLAAKALGLLVDPDPEPEGEAA